MSSSLKLIGSAQFRSFRNLWMLEELGLAYTHVPARPHSEEANAANPLGKIPTLVDGEFTMNESAAINTYLGDRYGGTSGLVPVPGTFERGRYEQVVTMLQSELDAQGLWIHRKHEALGHIFGTIPDAVAHAKSHSAKVVKVLADTIAASGGPYLLGPGFSAADIMCVHCLNWADAIGWVDEWHESNAGLKQYAELCRSREAYVRAKQLP